MQHDPSTTRIMTRRSAPRAAGGGWLQLIDALLRLGEGHGELIRHCERTWASATFSGTRHTVMLHFRGAEAIAAGERLIAALPDHEFALPRALVADATVREASHSLLPEPLLSVEAELLVLDEY